MSKVIDESPIKTETPINQAYHETVSNKVRYWDTLSPDYWAYRIKWEGYPKNHVVGSFPIHLDIEATNACNLKCVMCPRTDLVKRDAFWKIQMFDLDTYKKLIDEGVAHGLCSVKYNYLGEPLLNPHLVEMIKYAKSAGVIDVMFNTNATVLTEDLSRQLIASGLDKIFFSFDSPYREQYNQIRVGADFDKVLENIRRFNDIRKEMGGVKPLTRVSMVLMENNKDTYNDFCKLFEPIVDIVGFGYYIDHIDQSNPEYIIPRVSERKGKFCCPQLWQRMYIHPDGVVTVCCNDSARTLQMGNILDQPAHEIWTGDKYQRLRDLHSSGHYEDIPTCASCTLAMY